MKKKQIKKKLPKGQTRPDQVKYDFIEEKSEFMLSKHDTVAAFFRHRFGSEIDSNGNYGKRSAGWAVEKREIKKILYEKGIDNLIETKAVNLTKIVDDILLVSDDIMKRWKDANGIVNTVALKALFEVIMGLAGRPSKVTKRQVMQHNFNSDVPATEEDIVEHQKASNLLNIGLTTYRNPKPDHQEREDVDLS